MENFFHGGPPFPLGPILKRNLEGFTDVPPFSGSGIRGHLRHIGLEILKLYSK
jgi:hypothetical protein